MVKSESGGSLEIHLRDATYEQAYAERGKKPILGMEFQQNKETGGLEVVRVIPNAPADLAGARAGDKILQFAGAVMTNKMQFLQAVVATPYGTRVTMRVERAGKTLDLGLLPSIRPDSYKPGPGMVESNSYDELLQAYLTDVATFDERIAKLQLPPKYRAQAQQRKQHHVASLKAARDTCYPI